MSNRNLAHYEEPRNEHGDRHWTLDIDHSAVGRPGLLLTIRSTMLDRSRSHLDREMTVVVDDGNELLAPVLEWLGRA